MTARSLIIPLGSLITVSNAVSDEARILTHTPAALPLQTQFMETPPFQWLRPKTLESVSANYSQPASKRPAFTVDVSSGHFPWPPLLTLSPSHTGVSQIVAAGSDVLPRLPILTSLLSAHQPERVFSALSCRCPDTPKGSVVRGAGAQV